VKVGEKIEVPDYTADVAWRPEPFSGTALVDRVAAEWAAGATLVLQGLHLNWEPLAAFCRSLEGRLGHASQANAYWTPRHSQGLPVHHDTHDVFVLQVDGYKRWLVYPPALELPLKHQRYTAELGAPGETVLDVELRAGDTLYLPRGWLHEALTSDTDSLHITVGVVVTAWIDALRGALDRLEHDVELRRGVPADGAGGAALVERLKAELAPDRVRTWKRTRLVRTRRPVLTGQLTQLRALDALALETFVERRPTVLFDLTVGDAGEVALAFEGKTVTFPPQARAEVEALAGAEEGTRICDLPGRLDEPGRLVLVRRLVREGFLRILDP
jgi:hypothetical protein